MNAREVLAAIFGAFFGLVFGASLMLNSRAEDCEKLGSFRHNGKVFICEEKK